MAKRTWTYATLLDAAPKWLKGENETVKLWHGCTSDDADHIWNDGIDLTKCKEDTDFGRGFYLTHIERQARHWAWVRYFDLSLPQRMTQAPVTLEFELRRADLAPLHSLSFVSGSPDNHGYWSLVQYCRQSPAAPAHFTHEYFEAGHNGWYDVVHGPVAAFWYQKMATYDEDQISFHTDDAVRLLQKQIDRHRARNNRRWMNRFS